jgi:hypothetical protein
MILFTTISTRKELMTLVGLRIYHAIILTLFNDIIQKKALRGNEKIGDNETRRAEKCVYEAYYKLLSTNSTRESADMQEQSLGITGQQHKACLEFSLHLTYHVLSNVT